jgi:hypothetical protein
LIAGVSDSVTAASSGSNVRNSFSGLRNDVISICNRP